MGTEDTATTDPTTTTDPPAEPAAYVFPFEVPTDLGAVADDALRALHGQLREHAATFAGLAPADTTDETIAALQACRDLAVEIANVITGRLDRADAAAAALADIDADLPLPDDVVDLTGDPEPEPEPTAVTAARRPAPRVRDVARGAKAPTLPANAAPGPYAEMVSNASVAGFSSGQKLDRFHDAAKVLSARMDQFPSMTEQRARTTKGRRPVTVYDPSAGARTFELRSYQRQPGVELRRHFPEELRVRESDGERRGYSVAEYAASERRLPGGSLVESARLAVAAGRSLTAAAGWCAPSQPIYDLCELESLDGLLDLPELQTTRGGWQIPIDGGPDFASIWTSLGADGDTHLSEAEVIEEVPKVCTEIPCPDYEDVRLGVDYYCVTGGLLQRRAAPEIVARFGRGAVIALAHKINAGLINAIVAGSGAVNIIPPDPSGDDAASSLLSAVELAIVDSKYHNRMGFASTVETVLPWWTLQKIRAAMARRTGVAMMAVTDAQILEWFTVRKSVPRFVYDWQDSFAGLAGGPGATQPLTALPQEVQFLIYPAGTWVKAVQDVVALDTIYDSTLLTTNQFTAVFAEDGWAAMQMCPLSRLYAAQVDASGVTGCCPGLEGS